MSKKDFEAIARVIQSQPLLSEDRENLAHSFARMLAGQNPRFDYDRFLRACVPGANVRARS